MVAASGLLVALLAMWLSIPQVFLFMAVLNGLVSIYIYTLLPEFLFRFVAWMLAHVMYRLEVTGEDHVPNEGAALIVCYHVSFIDWFIISAGVKRPIRFIMDHSF